MNVRSGFRLAAVVAVVVVAASCSSGESSDAGSQEQASPSASASAPNPGLVFDGTYEATQVPEVRPDVTPTPPEFLTSVFSVKSFCPSDTGPCVASALSSYPNISPPPAPQPVVLDYVDGSWISRTDFAGTCTTADGTALSAPQWQETTLSQPDGVVDGSVITGTGSVFTGSPCTKQFSNTYTFTRTGPLDPALEIPPPDEIAPFVEASGSALSGAYDVDLSPLSSTGNRTSEPAAASGSFTSFCARTGDKCLSVFEGDNNIIPMLEWSGGMWSSNAVFAAADCANGSGQQVTTIRVSLARKDTGESPAQELSGELRKIYDGDCAGETAWTVTATRTGD